jgi:hypothetical protein
MIYQDYAQVYNNILDGSNSKIWVQKRLKYGHYKVTTWNNTLRNVSSDALDRHEKKQSVTNSAWDFDQDTDHYGYDYNNIIEGGKNSSPAGTYEIVNFAPYHSTQQPHKHDFSNTIHTNTLFVTPGAADGHLFRHYNVSYTAESYETSGPTGLPREIYVVNNSTPFLGSSGIDRYKTISNFIVEGSDTIANGGYSGPHPYLQGITIPSYLGATNPDIDSGSNWNPENPGQDDSGWVNYVYSLSNVNTLISGLAQSDPELEPDPSLASGENIMVPTNLRVVTGN